EYLELMKLLDLEIAGEFIEMVATLMLIKARTLLPGPQQEEIEDVEDPRLQLTMQLLEYKKFKEAASHLHQFEQQHRQYFPRKVKELRKQAGNDREETELEIDASLFDLLTAFKRAIDNMPKVTVHQIQTLNVSLEEQVKYVIDRFEEDDKTYLFFSDLIKNMTQKIYIVVTFLAILDLMKVKLISVKQNDMFEDIRLVRNQELSLSKYLSLRERVSVDETPQG
ncbi:MAG: segregation/condensation protein A, partial [Aliifodinibius sp.]|nr:segregation/condensation protein A [Fodinibius sp.]NIV16599.1 segregation/condensation protein A [Fodinibius sp.]NIY30583.1 segregation/condensation protein A [Fodinibius sp.]